MPNLRTLRQSANLSQSAAASLLGVSLRTLQGWEAGRDGTVAYRLACRLLEMLTARDRRSTP